MEQAKLYERRIGLLLRVGVFTSSVLMAAGLLLAALQPAQTASEYSPTLKELLRGLVSGELNSASGSPAFTLLFAGLLVLMLTPFLRVLAALFAFLAEKDWRFVGIAAVVFFILVGQLIYSLQ